MLKWIETTGRSEEDAITAALFQLGLDRDDVSVEVIERAKSGFLGFGSSIDCGIRRGRRMVYGYRVSGNSSSLQLVCQCVYLQRAGLEGCLESFG